MQTFAPEISFDRCAQVLDRMRLASQRRECCQLLYANDPHIRVGTPELIAKKNALAASGEPPKRGWSNHPAARMWTGRTPALLLYLQAMDNEWLRRGYKSNLLVPDVSETHGPVVLPSWWGDAAFHRSHQSNLLRKLPEHYEQFGWDVGPDLEYIWPGPCANLGQDFVSQPTLSVLEPR